MMYTALIYWGLDEPEEEIDVEATTVDEARTKVEQELARYYIPGWTQIDLTAFAGVYVTTYGGKS
jgi:hypothetical protein